MGFFSKKVKRTFDFKIFLNKHRSPHILSQTSFPNFVQHNINFLQVIVYSLIFTVLVFFKYDIKLMKLQSIKERSQKKNWIIFFKLGLSL